MSQLYTIIRKHQSALQAGEEIAIGTEDSVIHVLKKPDQDAVPDLEIYVSPFDEIVSLSTEAFLNEK